MKTEIRLIIEGVKSGKPFREVARELNGMDYAVRRRDDLVTQVGLPDWQPNITRVTIQTRQVTEWEDDEGELK